MDTPIITYDKKTTIFQRIYSYICKNDSAGLLYYMKYHREILDQSLNIFNQGAYLLKLSMIHGSSYKNTLKFF